MFLKFVDVLGICKIAIFFKRLDEVVKEVGKEDVQVVIDNAINYKAIRQMLMEKKKKKKKLY